PTEREIAQIFISPARPQTQRDYAEEIEEQNCGINGKPGVHVGGHLATDWHGFTQIKKKCFIRANLWREMNFTKIPASDFDLAMTLDTGQVFHWQEADGGFVGTIGELPAYMEQQREVLCAKVASACSRFLEKNAQDARATVAQYFALDHPLQAICNSFPKDPVMNGARDFCRGLRIIRQPKWECLATFICSSMKQVAHIRQISFALRKRFGEQRKIGKHLVYAFPSASRLARAFEKELRECKLGYRSKNLRATARLVSRGEANLEAWSALADAELRRQLCVLPGVGPKIANCVMLFAYE